uniref:Uncharacterized protein n=1 Tax=Molossus molossus TaxID=27622 RepID=A0A7J8GQ59_MOLMO|nr:hypothetical protein HJG59_011227 [Molossus molossus]
MAGQQSTSNLQEEVYPSPWVFCRALPPLTAESVPQMHCSPWGASDSILGCPPAQTCEAQLAVGDSDRENPTCSPSEMQPERSELCCVRHGEKFGHFCSMLGAPVWCARGQKNTHSTMDVWHLKNVTSSL